MSTNGLKAIAPVPTAPSLHQAPRLATHYARNANHARRVESHQPPARPAASRLLARTKQRAPQLYSHERSCVTAARSFRRVSCISARAPADTVGRARAAAQDQPHTCLRSRNRRRGKRGRLGRSCRRGMLARGSAAQNTGAGAFAPSYARTPVAGAESRGRISRRDADSTQTANPLSPAPALVLPTRPTRRTPSRSHRGALQVRRPRRVHRHEGPPAYRDVQTAHMDAPIPHRDASLHRETSSAHGGALAPLSHPLPPLPPPKRPLLRPPRERQWRLLRDRSVPGDMRGVLLRDVPAVLYLPLCRAIPQPCRILLAAAAIACALFPAAVIPLMPTVAATRCSAWRVLMGMICMIERGDAQREGDVITSRERDGCRSHTAMYRPSHVRGAPPAAPPAAPSPREQPGGTMTTPRAGTCAPIATCPCATCVTSMMCRIPMRDAPPSHDAPSLRGLPLDYPGPAAYSGQ
ncbi:hypothetical protein C8J57DRAFT_1668877 [Mycena rebaudengoi]|nr:hypothetical protein C8J57DRAFT_1668877 [Mycena rebaudengoi]